MADMRHVVSFGMGASVAAILTFMVSVSTLSSVPPAGQGAVAQGAGGADCEKSNAALVDMQLAVRQHDKKLQELLAKQVQQVQLEEIRKQADDHYTTHRESEKTYIEMLRKESADAAEEVRKQRLDMVALSKRNKELADAREKQRFAEAGASPDGTICRWVEHQGTYLGARLNTTWQWCAPEGGKCLCRGKLRYGNLAAPFYYKDGVDGEPDCTNVANGNKDPAPGLIKSCWCLGDNSENEKLVTLEKAKELCEKHGDPLCKGVTCDEGDDTKCQARNGVPYLAPEAGKTSYTYECTPVDAVVGGGLKGRHRVNGEPTIFVGVASLRDTATVETIQQLFKKARFPARVFVGVVCQRDDSDPQCVPRDWGCDLHAGPCARDQVRLREFSPSKSQGQTHAHVVASHLYRGEDFFMMIDPNMKFVTEWDVLLMEEYKSCSKDGVKCVLSTMPMTVPADKLDNQAQVAHLCATQAHAKAVVANHRAVTLSATNVPRPTMAVSLALLFGPGKLVLDAPFDPLLGEVSVGADVLYAARLWTRGYDLFTPGVAIAFRDGAKSSYQPNAADEDAAYQRLRHILSIPQEGKSDPLVSLGDLPEPLRKGLPKYGLGDSRKAADFWRYWRIDIRRRTGDISVHPEAQYYCKFTHPYGPYVVEEPPALPGSEEQ